MPQPRVLLLTGDGGETLEVYYTLQRLLEEGYAVDVAALEKRPAQLVVHDFVEGFSTYTEKPGHRVQVDVAVADVDPADYAALVVPGGRAPEYLRNDPDVQRVVRHFFERDTPVAAHCHGPMVLATAGVLRGRRSSGYPAIAPEVRAGGAEYVQEGGVVDGNLVTARDWGDHPAFVREFVRLLRKAAPVEPREPAGV